MIIKFKIFENIGIDPYGKDEWNEKEISEAVRWYNKGKLGEVEKREEKENRYDFILNYVNKEKTIYVFEIKKEKWNEFREYLKELNIKWNSGGSPDEYTPNLSIDNTYRICLFYRTDNDIRILGVNNIVGKTIITI
jgi:hypothetical protein